MLLHCLNHIADSAARIKHNNEAAKADAGGKELRDQGFVRAKVGLLSAGPVYMNALRQHTEVGAFGTVGSVMVCPFSLACLSPRSCGDSPAVLSQGGSTSYEQACICNGATMCSVLYSEVSTWLCCAADQYN